MKKKDYIVRSTVAYPVGWRVLYETSESSLPVFVSIVAEFYGPKAKTYAKEHAERLNREKK